MNLSDTIKKLSKELNISCSELARRSGQSAQNLNKKLNKNTLSFDEFEKLIKLMNVEMECGFIMPGGAPSDRAVYDEHIQDQLNILEKQLEVERMKSKYFVKLSYDFRTALNTISGGIDLAVNHSGDADRVVEYLEKIRPSIEQVTRLVADNPFNREAGMAGYVPELAASDYDFAKKKILIVEDNDLNREIIRELLEDAGAIVDEAINGQEAIETMRKSQSNYDFVLMDIQMPILNGFEATRQIRKLSDKTKARTPIIAMTASVTKEDKNEARECGMDDFIEKPLDIRKLVGILG